MIPRFEAETNGRLIPVIPDHCSHFLNAALWMSTQDSQFQRLVTLYSREFAVLTLLTLLTHDMAIIVIVSDDGHRAMLLRTVLPVLWKSASKIRVAS
jgi:hypothetical protein